MVIHIISTLQHSVPVTIFTNDVSFTVNHTNYYQPIKLPNNLNALSNSEITLRLPGDHKSYSEQRALSF